MFSFLNFAFSGSSRSKNPQQKRKSTYSKPHQPHFYLLMYCILVFQSYPLTFGVWSVCFWGPVIPPHVSLFGKPSFFFSGFKVTRKSANNHPKMHSAAPEKGSPEKLGFCCYFPKENYNPPRYRTPQAIPLANYESYSRLLVKVARGVFQRCAETTLDTWIFDQLFSLTLPKNKKTSSKNFWWHKGDLRGQDGHGSRPPELIQWL